MKTYIFAMIDKNVAGTFDSNSVKS